MFGKRLFRHVGIISILLTLLQPTTPAEVHTVEGTFETSIVTETNAEDNEIIVEENGIVIETETVVQETIPEETVSNEEETIPEETISNEEETAPEETIENEEETKPDETAAKEENVTCNATNYEDMHTGRLTAKKGYVTDSPCGGSETWYPYAPRGAVKMMEEYYGFSDLEITVREDGVRVLQGFRPNGEWFEGLVIVAADVRDDNDRFQRNMNGLFDRGDIVETSLGTGIVVDYCERSVRERKANGHIHIDISTAWRLNKI